MAGSDRTADVDAVVIGAGAAGIAAARGLHAAGLRVTVIEAAARIGGRVHTDTRIFGVPYDVGAHWLHYREANPFADYGVENGFDIYPAPEEAVMYVGDRPADDTEWRAFEKAEKRALKAMTRAARKGRDVSPAAVLPDLGDWGATVRLMTGPFEIGQDMHLFSCLDWDSAEEGTDYYCREGFGTLFAHWARDVPVSLGVTARRVRWDGPGVTVETDQGTLRARAVVVTVSMGVLRAGGITFEPALPVRKREAIAALGMGHYNHVVLQFRENFFGTGTDGYFSYRITEEVAGIPQGFAALIDAGGTGLAYCDLGGSLARDLGRAGQGASVDFVLGELRRMFGSRVDRALVRTGFYDWSADPLVRGAYSAALPGGAWSRKEMRRPEGGRVWFAGEALCKDDWATVAGAHKSGARAARKLARALQR